MPSKYTFADYSSDWPLEFERESARLQSLLGDVLIVVHHIGSTSVPGLPAKPIIDLLPIVQNLQQIDDLTNTLRDAGYKAWGEYGIVGRRLFTKDDEQNRTHNIHVFQKGNSEVERHLAFCCYLRHHSKARSEYAELKREAYSRHPANIQAYNDHKNEWIKRVEVIATEWFRPRFATTSAKLK